MCGRHWRRSLVHVVAEHADDPMGNARDAAAWVTAHARDTGTHLLPGVSERSDISWAIHKDRFGMSLTIFASDQHVKGSNQMDP
jgi:hypothetical protein